MVSDNYTKSTADFDSWIRSSLVTDEIVTGTTILEQVVDIHLISLYLELDFHHLLRDQNTAGKLAQKLGYTVE